MKTIPKIKLKDATLLTPLDMNRIQFETGRMSPMPVKPTVKAAGNAHS